MAIRRFLTMRATLTHRALGAGKDAYGNPIDDVTTTEDVRCLVQQGGSQEDLDGQDVVTIPTRAFFLPGTVLDAGDAVEVTFPPLGSFEVDGEPRRPWHPRRKREHHVEADLLRTEG